jgi:hypothetical protein
MLHSGGMVVIASLQVGRAAGVALLLAASIVVPRSRDVALAASAPAPTTAASDGGIDPLAGAQLIDGVVAVIGKQVVTLGQLRKDARVALANHGEVAAAFQPLDNQALASALDYLINQELVAGEARRLEVFEVSQAEVDAEQRSLEHRFHWPETLNAFLTRFAISEPELQAMLRRGLRARRYIDHRLRLQLQPDAGKVIAGPTLEELVTSLVSELRARSSVRILMDFRGPQHATSSEQPVPQ